MWLGVNLDENRMHIILGLMICDVIVALI